MAKRINLATNPCCKSNDSGWFGPSGWARSTSGNVGLPRGTGFKGTSTGAVISPRFGVLAGQSYVTSISAYFGSASTVDWGIDWYTSAQDYLGSTGYSSGTFGSGTVQRLEHGPVTAPAGAAYGVMVVANTDGALELTAHLVEQVSTIGGAFFDGDSTACTWASTPGNSISYKLTRTDAWTWSDSGSKQQTASGPVGGDSASWSEVGSVRASGTVADSPWTWSESALILSLGYDSRRGRIRLNAFGLSGAAVRAEVLSRSEGVSRWSPVRGGKVAIVGGAFARSVDHYEFVAGAATEYQVRILASQENTPDVLVGQAVARQPAVTDSVWLKFIARPSLNRRVQLTGWTPIERESRATFYDVINRRDPVATTDVHSSRRTTITLRTTTIAEAEDLDEALSLGLPLFLHTPKGVVLPSLYAVAGTYRAEPVAKTSTVQRWEIPLTEVAPPPPSVVGAALTWQTILDTYGTWAEVLAEFPTWADLVAG